MRPRNALLWISVCLCLPVAVVIGDDVAVQQQRPRIWINQDNLQSLRQKIKTDSATWQFVLAKCVDDPASEAVGFYSRGDWTGQAKITGLANCALNYLLTGDERQGREAVAIMMDHCSKGVGLLSYADGKMGALHVGAVCLAYDWCYDLMTPVQRQEVIAQMNEWVDWCMSSGKGNDQPSSNYFHRYLWVETAVALATFHENPKAPMYLRHAREHMLGSLAKPWLASHAKGGQWPEGNGSYDGPLFLAFSLAALKTATGEDLFAETSFFRDSVYYHLYATLPAVSGPVEVPQGRYDPKLLQSFYEKGPCLMYPSGEYAPDGYGIAVPGLYQYPEHTQFMTIAGWAMKTDVAARYARWWLDNTPGTAGHCAWKKPGKSKPLCEIVEFVFGDNTVQPKPPGELPTFYHAASAGFVTWRSSWERDATFFAFECGPRLSANQRRNANGIFLYKRGYLIGHVPNVRLETNNSVSVTIDGIGQTVMPRDSEPQLVACTDDRQYLYVAGQAAGAYNSSLFGRRLCEEFSRQVVLIKPGLFVLFDRLRPTDPNSSCEFLCFFGDRPLGQKDRQYAKTLGADASTDKSDIFVSRTPWDGKVYFQLLLPKESVQHAYPKMRHSPELRLAFTPADTGEQQSFLAVAYVPDMEATDHPDVQLHQDTQTVGITGRWGDKTFNVRFARQGDIAGRVTIKREGTALVDAKLE